MSGEVPQPITFLTFKSGRYRTDYAGHLLNRAAISLELTNLAHDRQSADVTPPSRLRISRTAKMTKKIKKSIFAIPAAVAAIPPNPKAAAIKAITGNTKAHPNKPIVLPFHKQINPALTLCANYSISSVLNRLATFLNIFAHAFDGVTPAEQES